MTSKAPLSIPLINFIRQNSALSRRDVSAKIIAGEVYVNNTPVCDSQYMVMPSDNVKVSGQRINKKEYLYYKFYKPVGVISTYKDPKARLDLDAYVKKHKLDASIRPIGRLDRDSSGLLLFSNDGEFIQQILHPSFLVKKTYELKLNAPLTEQIINTMSSGFFLDDGPVKIEFVKVLSMTHLIVSIHIGRNRILRRAFDYFNCPIIQLHRISIGDIQLNQMQPGSFMSLSDKEIKGLALDKRSW